MNPAEKFIYVSIDSLLDTRQGTLLHISPDVAFEITSQEQYHARTSDEFVSKTYGKLSVELFKQIKETYKHEIVFKSLKTKMYLFLQELINAYIDLSIGTPHVSTITIEVNLHPYNFSEEQIEYIMKAMVAHIGNAAAISIVNFDLNTFSLKDVAVKYDALIMYDPVNWLNSKHNEFKTGVLKETTLYLPKMNNVRPLTDKEKKDFSREVTDVYSFTQMLFTGFIRLVYIPVESYCADVPYTKTEVDKTA
jgi:hypothetical protein